MQPIQVTSYELTNEEPLLTLKEERVSMFLLLLVPFIIAISSGVAYMPGWNYLIKALGVILAIGALIGMMRSRIRLATEVWLFALIVLWSLTGIKVAKYPTLHLLAWSTIAQMLILLTIVSFFTNSSKALKINCIAQVIGASVLVMYCIMTGEYQQVLFATGEEARAGGYVGTNTFGSMMLQTSMVLACLWLIPMRFDKIKRLVVLGGFAATIFFIILSGSRKVVLVLPLFIILWIWFSYRRELFSRIQIFLVIFLILSVGGIMFFHFVGKSAAGQRLQETWLELRTGREGTGIATRIGLITGAVRLIIDNPIFGIGLNHVEVYIGNISHCDFIELGAGTGLPGLLLYAGIYFVLWRRLTFIIKNTWDPASVKIAGLIKASILGIFLLGLGDPCYPRKEFWVMLGTFIGWAHYQVTAIKEAQNIQSYEFDEHLPVAEQ